MPAEAASPSSIHVFTFLPGQAPLTQHQQLFGLQPALITQELLPSTLRQLQDDPLYYHRPYRR